MVQAVPPNPIAAIVIFDIDGVIRDVAGSYRRALADTVEHFTDSVYRPSSAEVDLLKAEGIWNNDWEASRELIYRYFRSEGRSLPDLDYEALVAWFQSRYWGPSDEQGTGYICDEPLLLESSYLEGLTQTGIPWGFFSGASRASASYVLEKRLGLQSPLVIAMEDAPGKPDATGLLKATQELEQLDGEQRAARSTSTTGSSGTLNRSVIYVGDTVADMYTVQNARKLQPRRWWIGVGVLPPHVQDSSAKEDYISLLTTAGAAIVFNNVQELSIDQIRELTRPRRQSDRR